MTTDQYRQTTSDWTTQVVRRHAGSPLTEAVFLLAIGIYWHMTGLIGISSSRLYNLSVDLVVWTFLIGGTLFLAIAGLAYAGKQVALILDALASLVVGLILLAAGVLWLGRGDFQGIIVLLFAFFTLRSAGASWSLYRSIAQHTAVAELEEHEFAPPPRDADMPMHPDMINTAEPEHAETRAPGPKYAEPPATPAAEPADAKPTQQEERLPEPPVDEPPPEGFLADLGRNDRSPNE